MNKEIQEHDERIKQLVSQIKNLDDRFDVTGPSEPAIYRSGVEPAIPWEKKTIEETCGIVLPSDLSQIWDHGSRINVYVDITYGHWGSIIWSPAEIIKKQKWKMTRFYAEEDFQKGDLVVGEFPGNYDLALILRCDENEKDFGTVIVASSMEQREEWNTVASSIVDFLEKLIAACGLMYWEPGFKFDDNLIENWWSGEM